MLTEILHQYSSDTADTGDATLRRHPRLPAAGPSRGPAVAPAPAAELPDPEHAEYIRCLTDRLSTTFDF